MKKKTVNKVVTAVFAMAFVCAAGGVATYTYDVSAATTTPTALNEVSFDMVYGASMRVATKEKPNATTGLRFSAKMPVEHWSWLTKTYGDENVSFGTIIAPASYNDNVVVNEDSLFGKTATYYWEGKAEAIGTVQVLQMDSSIYEYTDEKTNETYMRVNGSIGPVKPGNYNKEFFGVCYMAINTGSGVEYVCATENDNDRSLLYVAQRALDMQGWATDSVEYTTTKEFVDGYIAAYKQANGDVAPTVQYTVNKIYDDDTPMQTKTYTADLGERITLDEADYTTDARYEIDKTKSTMSGTAYTQDKLVLNVYYKKAPFFTAGANVTNLTDNGNGVWTFNPTDNYVVVKLTPAYMQDLSARNVAALRIKFSNPNGLLAFNWEAPSGLGVKPIMYAGTGEHPCIWTVDVADLVNRTNPVDMYFYHHTMTGENLCAETLQMDVVEIDTKEAAYVKTRFGINDVTYNGNLSWAFAMAAKDFSIHVDGKYLQDAVNRGVGKITLTWANPNGSFITDWAEMSFGTRPTTYPSSFSWTLDSATDYSAGLTLRMFHHDNVAGSAQKVETLQLTITEAKKEESWVTGVANVTSVTHVSGLTWALTLTDHYATFNINGNYLKEAAKRGVTDINVAFSNPNGGLGIEFLSSSFGLIPKADNYRYVKNWTWCLSQAADYTNGLEIYFYNNNGGSSYAQTIHVTITEKTSGGTVRAIRNISNVTVVNENTTKFTLSDVNYMYIDYYVSGDYLTEAVNNGAKSVKIAYSLESGGAMGVEWISVSYGTKPSGYPTSFTLTLDSTVDYGVGLYVRCYVRDNSTMIGPVNMLVTLTQNM